MIPHPKTATVFFFFCQKKMILNLNLKIKCFVFVHVLCINLKRCTCMHISGKKITMEYLVEREYLVLIPDNGWGNCSIDFAGDWEIFASQTTRVNFPSKVTL